MSDYLLLTKHNMVLGEFGNYLDVARYLGAYIDNEGFIHICGSASNPSYVLFDKDPQNGFTKEKALRDWSINHMPGYIKRHHYKLYRVERT